MGSKRELSMADHDKPTVTSNYLDFVNEMHGRMDDLAVGLDPERTSATNVPNYSIRWSSVAKKWQYLDGSTWKDLTSEYAINIAGHAEKLKTPRTIQITGGGSSDAVAFDGTKNIEIPLNSLDLDNLTGLGSAAGVDVVQSTGSSEDDVMSQKATTDALNEKADSADLGSAAARDVVSSSTDTSGGNKVITQGWMGLGKTYTLNNTISDAKSIRHTGFFGNYAGVQVLNVMHSTQPDEYQVQVELPTTIDDLVWRYRNNGVWSSDFTIYHSGIITPVPTSRTISAGTGL